MKDLSQQENNIQNKEITCVSIYPNTDTAKDTDTVTVLDSSFVSWQNNRVLLMKTIPFNEENITGFDEDPQVSSILINYFSIKVLSREFYIFFIF